MVEFFKFDYFSSSWLDSPDSWGVAALLKGSVFESRSKKFAFLLLWCCFSKLSHFFLLCTTCCSHLHHKETPVAAGAIYWISPRDHTERKPSGQDFFAVLCRFLKVGKCHAVTMERGMMLVAAPSKKDQLFQQHRLCCSTKTASVGCKNDSRRRRPVVIIFSELSDDCVYMWVRHINIRTKRSFCITINRGSKSVSYKIL